MRSFAVASTSAPTALALRRRHLVAPARRVSSRVWTRASSDEEAGAPSVATSGRGGGTPGSWNLGVAHSAANSTDQRSFVDSLFKAYPTLVAAARDGDEAKVAALMDGVYVAAPDASTKKIRDAQVRAAALEAIRSGKEKTLRTLLDRGADLGIGDADEALDGDGDGGGDGGVGGALARGAAEAGHAAVLDVLLDVCGVRVTSKDAKTGRTPLLCAAANGHEACVARVLARLMDGDDGAAARACLDAVDGDGNTAAMLAAENDRAGCLNQLRGAGCDMEIARESDGATAMGIHRARVLSRIRCIED
jgi:hypothetical protein